MTAAAPERIVVVGNGVAGLTACDTLRANGFDGELTVVGDEPHPPYSRPALSKTLLCDDAETVSHRLPDPTHGAREIRGVSATRLQVDRRLLHLSDGSELSYDALVIATGSRARQMVAPSTAEHDSVLTLRNLGDALALRRRLAGRPTVIVVGGGPLGMEIASACLTAGCGTTVISDVPPLSRHLGTHLSQLFITAALERGLKLLTSGSAAVARPSSGAAAVVSVDGAVLEADLVVTATGDIPNVEWLEGSGLLTDGEIRVDSRGRLRPDIVAVGDVAAFPTRRGVRRVPLWSAAIDQAKVAAAALLFGDDAAELEFQSYFWTEQFGLSLKACGELPATGDPDLIDHSDDQGSALLLWAHADGLGTAAAINRRIPIPKLRRLAQQPPTEGRAASA